MLKVGQIYPKSKESFFRNPWDRFLLDRDYGLVEKKRIEDVKSWFKEFYRSSVGSTLNDVTYYVIPAKASSQLKATIADRYNFAHLSALKNDSQLPILLLMPRDMNYPGDYNLIKVINPKKEFLHDLSTNEVIHCIYAEDYEILPQENIYLDVPFEKRRVQSFFRECNIAEKSILKSFQAIVSGSPYVLNDKGGISSSMYSMKGTFSEEFLLTLKLMQPPEFTDIHKDYPPSLIKGKAISSPAIFGSKMLYSEKPAFGQNYFSAISSQGYKPLNNELMRRNKFHGEYSIFSSLNLRGESQRDVLNNIFAKSVDTEISNSLELSELKEYDVDLTIAKRNIDEHLKIQIANQKFISPKLPEKNELKELRSSLTGDWDGIFESMNVKNPETSELNVFAGKSFDNVLRIAQSLARDVGRNYVDEDTINDAYKLFITNMESITDNEEIRSKAFVDASKVHETKKFNVIRAVLSTNNYTITELFEELKHYFRDLLDLQKYVDRLKEEGEIFEPRRGEYSWIN
ncbi:hypothetical protein CMI42_01285 [Candidatus Pacearchaeota archaeon]|nr:hypothetical protein [Candidatus Pacearchaeota archaeon]|tara:strand:+ start:231 stop:1778 length:1548 start_codon:yes stop_codon:yes gene_type:complete